MTMLKPKRRSHRLWLLGAAATVLLTLLVASAAGNLAGSPFDAADGNLVLNDETQDWVNAPNRVGAIDLPTGQHDNSFGQGTKEDTAVPSVVDGGIPNNKSDLTRFYVANEKVGTDEYMYLAWERVQEPSGTTNMDFEFNQSSVVSSNGVTPVRTAGDVLIKYDLSQGGTNPTLGFHRWVTTGNPATVCEASNSLPCWDKVHNLAGNFEGAINTAVVSDPIPPNAPRSLSVRTFGEAAINLTAAGILPGAGQGNPCGGFSGAYLKSRSSDSFTAALKDFIAPIPVEIRNCGNIIIDKVTTPSGDPTSFNFALTGGPSNLNDSFALTDAATPHDSGLVLAGSGYNAAETVPSGWELTSATCDDGSPVTNIDVSVNETVTCTFNNRAKGTVIIKKITDDGHGTFGFTSNSLSPASWNLTTTAAGNAGADSKTFADIAPGTYDAAETATTGWHLVGTPSCSDSSPVTAISLQAGETVTCTFHNARDQGGIDITKLRKHAALGSGEFPHAGVTFTVTGGELPTAGVTAVTNAQGHACVDGLVLSSFVGDYTVTETLPTGYHNATLSQTATVSSAATCSTGTRPEKTFHNIPLTNITLSVDSQVVGGTASHIVCNGEEADTNAVTGDGSLTLSNLEPTDPAVTVTCTVTVDP
jgi:hypothetical protein